MKTIIKKNDSCIQLADLRPGEKGQLCEHPQPGLTPRLRDLGFVTGTSLEVVRAAPLGDPIEVEIRGARLCLRRSSAAGLCVTRESARA